MRVKARICSFLFSMVMLLMLCPANLIAADEAYTYTVRFYAGKQGDFSGSQLVELTGLTYGQRVSFHQGKVTLSDNSKYYVKGIRESGKDNNTSLEAASFLVTEDRDYVVAYGILGDAVAYTVSYVDENGTELLPSETFYGNVGDKPVIAFQYIEGYEPQTYNLTGLLKEDASKNVFQFVYSPVTNEVGPGGQNAVGGLVAGNDAGAGNNAEAGNNANAGNDAEAGENEDARPDAEYVEENQVADILDDETPKADGPEEVIDIDDEAIPLSPKEVVEEIITSKDGIILLGCIIIVIALVIIIRFLVSRKNKGKNKSSKNETKEE